MVLIAVGDRRPLAKVLIAVAGNIVGKEYGGAWEWTRLSKQPTFIFTIKKQLL
jgi:hypothetical protein